MSKHAAHTVTAMALSFALVGNASGQAVAVGVKGGWTHAEATLPLHSSVERIRANGFHAGAFVEMRFGPTLGIQIGALYSEKGLGGRGRGGDLQYEVEVGYVEIPVLAKIQAPRSFGDAVSPYLLAGPTVGFEVNCRVHGKDGPEYLNYLCDGPPVHFDQRKKLDYGLMIGAGLQIPAGFGRLVMEAAYELGIRDLADSPDIPGEVRNGALMLSMGFATGKGR